MDAAQPGMGELGDELPAAVEDEEPLGVRHDEAVAVHGQPLRPPDAAARVRVARPVRALGYWAAGEHPSGVEVEEAQEAAGLGEPAAAYERRDGSPHGQVRSATQTTYSGRGSAGETTHES